MPPNASSNDDLYNNQSPRPHLAGESNCEQNGEPGLQAAKQWAAAVLDAGGAGSPPGQKVLFVLDKELLELGVSPGGSADLLAGTLFLDAIERDQTRIAINTITDPTFVNSVSLW